MRRDPKYNCNSSREVSQRKLDDSVDKIQKPYIGPYQPRWVQEILQGIYRWVTEACAPAIHNHRFEQLENVDDVEPEDNQVYTFSAAQKRWVLVDMPAASGDVTGPAGATANNFASYDGTTGKVLKDSGSKAADFATASHNHSGVYDPAGTAATAVGNHESTYNHANLHTAATVSGNGIQLSGQQISLQIGTGPTQVAAGNHAHAGVYDPAGTASGLISTHESTYDHGDIATAMAHTTSTGNPHGTEIGDLDDVDLTGLADDYILVYDAASQTWLPEAQSSGGVSDHGLLTGLLDDDHTQYLTNTRGDARYSPTGHNHDTVYAAMAHASQHASGGADSLKLDDLAAPDDNTDLDASTSKHGLLKKLSNVSTEFLNGAGSWATPAGAVQDKIEEGNSKIEVVDSGTGYISVYIDGAEKYRLGTSGIYDTSGKLLIGLTATASAVNYVKVSNSATSTPISLTVDGTDSNIPFELKSKGTSSVLLTVGSYSFSIDSNGTCVVSQGDLELMLGNIFLPSGGYVKVGTDTGTDSDISFDVDGQHYEISARGGIITRLTQM